ncbi:MAG: 50S ribosomal protein L15 [Thermoproteota archaeon]|nr:MAG: 50S ribosomal protein L15 [Candidatus Korarchaeota archaeon]
MPWRRPRKKSRKLRGSRTHGYGIQGQHRGSGARGGFGKAGLKKHKWTWVVKYAPDYFGAGRRGFKPPTKKTEVERPVVNVDQLEELLGKVRPSERDEKGLPILNLIELGYGKLLGRGNVTAAMHVVVAAASKSAIEKVEKAGGVIEVVSASHALS